MKKGGGSRRATQVYRLTFLGREILGKLEREIQGNPKRNTGTLGKPEGNPGQSHFKYQNIECFVLTTASELPGFYLVWSGHQR